MPERTNPFQPIYDLCNAGGSAAKHAHLPAFPRLLDLELTNLCNFRCLMCPTGTFAQRRDKGFMADAVFFRILDEVAERGAALRFIRFGEPTMHPRFVNYIRAAHDRGVLTHVNTNGSKMDEPMMAALCEIPLDSLKFSFQGVDAQSYAEMRNIDFFDDLVAVIGRFDAIRGDRDKPHVHVSTSITYETPADVTAFRERLAPLVDKLTVGHTVLDHLDMNAVRLRPHETQRLRELKVLQSAVREHPECPEVYDKLSVNWDGTVTACCGDWDKAMVIGDVRQDSLATIWTAPALETFRSVLARGGHDELPLCRTCYNYAGLYKVYQQQD